MVNHISARLAWHDNGWNGHICKNPRENIYCVGSHSYPGDLIAQKRDLEWESQDSIVGSDCENIDAIPPCIYSINAFGKKTLQAFSEPPDWLDKNAQTKYFNLPPATVCVWPYEEMYSDDVKRRGPGQTYDYNKRLKKAKEYFNSLKPDKTLIFYYANYSNPFSEDENKKYVLVGISRLKSLGKIMYYDGTSQKTKEKYGGGFVWQMPITSYYPEEGFRLPYHLYNNKPEILNNIVFIPENERNFKYATRKISDDDALILVEKLLETVDKLIEIGDKSENWVKQKKWLQSLLAELWDNRGAFPGLPMVLDFINFQDAIPYFKEMVKQQKEIEAKTKIFNYLKSKIDSIKGLDIIGSEARKIRRNWKLLSQDKRKLLEEVLPRLSLSQKKIERIISDQREIYGITATLDKILNNPYILSEQYVGDDPDDRILFSTIDHGIIPSPDIPLNNLFEKDSGQRLRALIVEQLKRETQHTFVLAETLLHSINLRLSYLSDWNKHQYTMRHFEVDKDILSEALVFRKTNNRLYIYLKEVFQDEKKIYETITNLIKRSDIVLRKPITKQMWFNFLCEKDNKLAREYPDEYNKAIENQVEICQKLFTKSLAVITGAAGTGKTHLIKGLVDGIKKTEGEGVSIRLLAPTGKATDRIRRESKDIQTSTIHSFLAERGWLNDNLTLKREGGRKEQSISVYIIDETSMLNTNLVATLFRAINWHFVKRLIFIGDPNQLPPIGRGKFFADLIEYLKEVAPETLGNLKINFRQMENGLLKKGEGIISLASLYTSENKVDEIAINTLLSKVQEGGKCFKDLRVFYWNEPEELEYLLISSIKEDIQKDINEKIPDEKFYYGWNKAHRSGNLLRDDYLQIISPYRGELYGTENINQLMQQFVNGHNIDRRGLVGGITLFDKVIQYRNRPKSDPYYAYNYQTRKKEKVEVYNGEIGFVKPHGFDKNKWAKPWFKLRRFQVIFSCKPHYGIEFNDKSVEDNIELAYAISVHKSQGSEFDRVYFVLPKSKKILLTRELLYTAITRARKHLTIFVEKDFEPFLSLLREENSSLKRINSSIFKFEPLPEDLVNINNWYEEGKIHRTLAEYMVRSKSEVIIANMLFDRGIEFWYEKPLYAPDGTFHLPDFTIMWEGQEWYWEHLGLLDDDKYRKYWEKKKKWYERFFPGLLITTRESSNLSKDAEELINEFFSY